MFLWESFTRKAVNARLSSALLCFFSVQILLFIPTAYSMLKTAPYEMYARIHGGPAMDGFANVGEWNVSVGETADGFVSFIRIEEDTWLSTEPEASENTTGISTSVYAVHLSPQNDGLPGEDEPADYVFGITPAYAYYRDANAELVIPVEQIPAWVFKEKDLNELFNYLALNNQYFTRVLLPLILFMLLVYMIGQIVFYWAIAWLFGLMRKVSTYMTFRERFVVCVYASLPALPFGLLFGFIAPVMNIFAFELVVLYVAYKMLKD